MDAIPDSEGDVNTEAGKRSDFLHRGVRGASTNGDGGSKAGEIIEMAPPTRQLVKGEEGMY